MGRPVSCVSSYNMKGRRNYALFFCLALTLHNVEEALWLPNWSKNSSSFQKPVTSSEFHFAVLIITILAYLVSFLYVHFPKSKIAKRIFIGFLGSMIFNAFFPHLIAAVSMKTYAPGLGTAFFLNIPINTIILYRLYKGKSITLKEIILATIVVGIFLLALIPFLFILGGVLPHVV